MKRTICCILLLVLISCSSVFGATLPVYQNTDRHWGTVTAVFPSVISGLPWVAFVLLHPDGSSVRFDCDTRAHTLGCDLVHQGQSILISGHTEDTKLPSCRWDGADFVLVPNVIWNCDSGTCVQITP